MPSISNLSAGLKLSSSGNANALGEITLGGNPIFNSQYLSGGSTAPVFSDTGGTANVGAGQTAVFTVNPSAQASGSVGVIMAGRALVLFVEYNSLGQFRFDVIPAGTATLGTANKIIDAGVIATPSVASAWYPVGTEHTVGVSYTNVGIVTMIVDGEFASSRYVDPTLMQGGNEGLTIGSYNGRTTGSGYFNGFVGQVVNFKGPLAPTELASITADPSGLAGSLGGTLIPATNGHIESAISYRGAGSTITTNNTINGVANSTARTIGTDFFKESTTITATGAIAGLNTLTTSANGYTQDAGGYQNAGNIRAGDFITGTGIPDGDFVTAVTSATSITLRSGITAPINAGTINVYHAEAVGRQEITTSTSPSTLPSASTTPTAVQLGFLNNTPGLALGDIVLRLDSVAGVRGGDLVAGGGLPGGYTVYATGILGSTDSVVITSGGTLATSPVNAGAPIYFVNPNARDAQSITIFSNTTPGYVAGDSIQITAASSPSGATVTKTYVVQVGDVLSTPALTNSKIANSIVALNPTIGLYALAQNSGSNTNQIVMAPILNTTPTIDTSNAGLATLSGSSTTYPLPAVIAKSINTAQVNENNVLDAQNFSSIPAGTLSSSTFTLTSSAGLTTSLQNSNGQLLSTSNGAINPGSVTFAGNASIFNIVTSQPVLKGPIYAELSNFSTSGATGTGVYDLFINPSFVKNASLNSLGFIINPSAYAPSGTIVSLVPTINDLVTKNNGTLSNSNLVNGSVSSLQPSGPGSLYQSNLIDGNINFQWVSSTGITDYSKPIARLTVLNAETSQASFNSTVNRVSINGGYVMDTNNPSLPMVESLVLPSQVYTVTGTVYQQYNKGSSSFDLAKSDTAIAAGQQVVIPQTDMTFVVKSGTSNINLNMQDISSPVTVASPNPVVKIDVIDTLLAPGVNTFTYNINVPSNATNISFTPGVGVSGLNVVNNGSYLTVSGTYGGSAPTSTTSGTSPVTNTVTAPAVLQNTNTPILGTLTAKLNNMMTSVNGVVSGGTSANPSKGVQFSIDSATLNGNTATAQSLYFGAAETNANGTYTLSNLPLGQLSLNVYNNTAQAALKLSNVSLNDAMSALSIAAGKGVVSSTTVGTAATLGVSDFVAADFNKDGKVTAADSLAILQYFVNYSNMNSAPLSYSYFPSSQQGFVGAGKVGVINAVAPAFSIISTNINATNSTVLNFGGSQTLDIVGVLQGDVI